MKMRNGWSPLTSHSILAVTLNVLEMNGVSGTNFRTQDVGELSWSAAVLGVCSCYTFRPIDKEILNFHVRYSVVSRKFVDRGPVSERCLRPPHRPARPGTCTSPRHPCKAKAVNKPPEFGGPSHLVLADTPADRPDSSLSKA